MPSKADIRAEAERLFAFFRTKGAQPVETDLLQPAETLLDLYGEDIRARAYVTGDPVRGELMMRPDFTVPVVQMHMNDGAEPARYTYMGEVFRMQGAGTGRASEYMQVGYEIFDRHDPAAADAEVFSIFHEALAPLGLRAATGDIGILAAAVQGLSTSERRKAALMRHIWRPRRFRALLERFAGRGAAPVQRAELVARLQQADAGDLIDAAGPELGLRSRAEVLDRLQALVADATVEPLPEAELDAVSAILALADTAPNALRRLGEIAGVLPSLRQAIETLEARIAALSARGIAVETLPFEGSYGRSTMEYYDGFVFGFYPEGTDMPAIATGGRYDALTRVLGQGRAIPAVGGVIRPEQALRVAGGGMS
ncbi:MAG: ATP phosphoribosyltransferase regulatory subunit [Paracoccaceae bacterium]